MIKLTKTLILPNCHMPNGFFIYICKLRTGSLSFFCVSGSLLRENMRGFREITLQENPALGSKGEKSYDES